MHWYWNLDHTYIMVVGKDCIKSTLFILVNAPLGAQVVYTGGRLGSDSLVFLACMATVV